MYIDLQPSALVGRGYESKDGYEKRDPYKLVFSVFLLGDGEAYVHAMNGGRVSLQVIGQIAKKLHDEYGVVVVVAERNGKKQRYDVIKVLARVEELGASLL